MKITVLCGGDSPERQVSLRSGQRVCEALVSEGNEVVCIDVLTGAPPLNSLHLPHGKPLHEDVLPLCLDSDAVFLALHGGIGENGQLQAFLDCHGIKYTGASFLPSAICMDKGISRALLSQNGVPIPRGTVLSRGDVIPDLPFPCCVKPAAAGSSVGVSFADDERSLKTALDAAFSVCDRVVIEERLFGRELTVGIIDGRALPTVEILPKTDFYNYESKYNPSLVSEICPAPLTDAEDKAVKDVALAACKALLLDSYCRVDLILSGGVPYCLEINTLPGMTDTSLLPLAAREDGISFSELCSTIIKSSLDRHVLY